MATTEKTEKNPYPSLPLDQHWTIAYRKRTGPVFHRVVNWSGTWQQAHDKAAEFGAANPDLQVWYTTTLAYEKAQAADLPSRVASGEYSQDLANSYLEDHGNLLVDSGKRVRVVDNGVLPVELGGTPPKPATAAKTQRLLDRAAKLGLVVEEHTDGTPMQTLTSRSWIVRNADDPNNIYGRIFIHELRWNSSPGRAKLAVSYFGHSGKTRKIQVRNAAFWLSTIVR